MYMEMCAELCFTCGRNKENISLRDHLLGSKAATKAFKKFRKFSVSSSDKTSLCASCRFDAIITHAVDCLLDIY